ncbi:putative soyasaponin III rhamnosyltransferase [Helianthus debilis subsp. tardiflorus]
MGPPDELRWGRRCKLWLTGLIMLRNLHVPDESGKSSGQRLSRIIEACEFVVIRSCKEFEGEYINRLQKLYKRPVLPIEQKILSTQTGQTLLSGFDMKAPKSVLFVGFGSEYKMPIEQVHELAYGLELSGLDFIWVLRKPKGVDGPGQLPPNFEVSVFGKGVVRLGWAPQMEILAHPSIGGRLFHSGWGSVIESLGMGHPLILMPKVADQGLCVKLMVEKEVGYEVPRNEDGSFTRDMVAESVKLVMESRAIREKASQMSSVFCDQNLQENYISSFVSYLQRFKRST